MNSSEDKNSFDTNEENIEEKENLNLETSKQSEDENDNYRFGWSKYAEITNGRFAMIGFLSILLIELLSNDSFLKWSGIIN
tara:strand:+ start:4549 stop:4791 length:243 start_codon:yes stop_codon:yes gene_type:complete